MAQFNSKSYNPRGLRQYSFKTANGTITVTAPNYGTAVQKVQTITKMYINRTNTIQALLQA